ncbi:MAG TPA: Mur ligase family protein [Candidatus Saccharimonadales bacterium]|nr:Mur ligase family protein [Candidatus Saccharimonadales bacterium]
MIRAALSLYSVRYPSTIVYMLQSCEYRPGPFLAWYWRTQDFSSVAHRRDLERTKRARLLLTVLRAGMFAQIVAGILLIALWHFNGLSGGWQFGFALILSYPIVWAHLITIPLYLGKWFVVAPQERRLISQSKHIFSSHRAICIAVAGSYGKTSMKEILLTVLSEGKKVAATPANKNVSVSHAKFARNLSGDEEVIIVEFGEGKPGDVKRFANYTQPTHAVITGLAPAHLDRYKTLQNAGKDIFSLAEFLDHRNVYVNGESPDAVDFIAKGDDVYTAEGALGWNISNINLAITGTSFVMTKGKHKMKLASSLLGRHNVGPLALAAALAYEIGLSEKQIISGVAKVLPYEHRMQPYSLGGAWVVDDTYNGNIEGVRAGTELLKALPAKRKIYVTPGLVDQGKKSKEIHETMGELIAKAKPDQVVLMHNSAAPHIKAGLDKAKYKGEITIEKDPLLFYTNLDQFVAVGDIVLMQNDWTDNYA